MWHFSSTHGSLLFLDIYPDHGFSTYGRRHIDIWYLSLSGICDHASSTAAGRLSDIISIWHPLGFPGCLELFGLYVGRHRTDCGVVIYWHVDDGSNLPSRLLFVGTAKLGDGDRRRRTRNDDFAGRGEEGRGTATLQMSEVLSVTRWDLRVTQHRFSSTSPWPTCDGSVGRGGIIEVRSEKEGEW